ncbi:MAG: hypothetical protein ACOC3F_04225, partial [Desulfosudaceae bacterium]
MKYFPLRIAALLIVVTPLLLFFTVSSIGWMVENRYTRGIENRYIGDTEPLFTGEVRLREAVSDNIDQYLQNRLLPSLGLQVDVTVTAGQNIIVYP